MASRNLRSFKSDESFLQKIAIGAIGTKRVYDDLSTQGHRPIELERGSMSFKIWKAIKIKRLRVPDILCVDCGTRVESRAKTKMEITMSHSLSDPERGWDFGLNDEDFVALVLCMKSGDKPIDWQPSDLVQYIAVSDLRRAFQEGHVHQERPKGAEEGFESRITWPASVASSDGIISEINDTRIKFKRLHDNRTISLSLDKKGVRLQPLVNVGEQISQSQIIAAVVPVFRQVPCSHDHSEAHYIKLLTSPSITERYAAAKALSYFSFDNAIPILRKTINDDREHIYIRLEAAATLMRAGQPEGVSFIETCLHDQYLENRLEAIIVLGEIDSSESCALLSKCLLDNNQHPEIRAGAAWSLGELGSRNALDALIESFRSVENSIRIEAARALAKLTRSYGEEVLNRFPSSSPEQRPGIAWAISKAAAGFSVEDLLPTCVDDDARQWVAYIIGTQEPESYVEQIEALRERDPEVYFAVTVLWKIMTSWINGLEEY